MTTIEERVRVLELVSDERAEAEARQPHPDARAIAAATSGAGIDVAIGVVLLAGAVVFVGWHAMREARAIRRALDALADAAAGG